MKNFLKKILISLVHIFLVKFSNASDLSVVKSDDRTLIYRKTFQSTQKKSLKEESIPLSQKEILSENFKTKSKENLQQELKSLKKQYKILKDYLPSSVDLSDLSKEITELKLKLKIKKF